MTLYPVYRSVCLTSCDVVTYSLSYLANKRESGSTASGPGSFPEMPAVGYAVAVSRSVTACPALWPWGREAGLPHGLATPHGPQSSLLGPYQLAAAVSLRSGHGSRGTGWEGFHLLWAAWISLTQAHEAGWPGARAPGGFRAAWGWVYRMERAGDSVGNSK